MHPIITTLGDFSLYSWGVSLVIAVLGGVFIFWRGAVEDDNDPEEAIDIAAAGLIGGFIGARFVWIALHFNDFGLNIINWILINRFPGLNFWGGVFGAIIIASLVARRKKWKVLKTLDLAGKPLIFGSILVWFGHFLNGSAYGSSADLWWATLAPGLVGQRHPVQIYMALAFLALYFVFNKFAKKKRFAGAKFLFAIIWTTIIIFVFDYYRAERELLIGRFLSRTQLEAIGSLAILIIWGYWISGRNIFKDIKGILKFFGGLVTGTGNFFLSKRFRKRVVKKTFRSPQSIGQGVMDWTFETKSKLVWKLTHMKSFKKNRGGKATKRAQK